MREISPVYTQGTPGYYSPRDLVLQMIVYGDITAWRTARMMRVAEESRIEGRTVLVLTENEQVEHLASQGFVIYRPSVQGLNPKVDALTIVDALRNGKSVVVNTDQIEQLDKNMLVRHINNGLATMSLRDLAIVVESTEAFYPRRRSRGDNAGMDTMNNLLKRAKAAGAYVAFAAESPDEIAVEISRSCGTPVVGCISNEDRAKAVAKSVDMRLMKPRDEMYGMKTLNQNDFYIFNRFTAPRQGQGQLPLEIDVTMASVVQMAIVPCWLRDQILACGFDPNTPTPPPTIDRDEQKRFETELETARQEADEVPAIAAKTSAAPVKATVSGANDNTRKATARRSRNRLENRGEGVAIIEAAGLTNALRMMTYARTVLNARNGKLNIALDGRATARSVANKVIEDEALREAIMAGYSIAHRSRKTDHVVSGTAYATAYYQAMIEDLDLARSFHTEMSVAGLRTGRRSERAIDMHAAMARIGEGGDPAVRAEAQYQLVRNAWGVYAMLNRKPLPQAA